MTRPASRRRTRPSGFTLVELLVVLVIIAVLIALLVPAIAGAVRTARAAAVQAEINAMAQGLADFKSKMGDYPPSRIVLNETGYFNTGSTAVPSPGYNDVTLGQLAQRTVTAFRKFWPRVPVSTSGGLGFTQATAWYDFNGDGAFQGNTNFVLMGPECLTFFLGGIPSVDLNGGRFTGMTGFGKNPVNPFSNNIASEPRFGRNGAPSVMYNANRNAPYFEFAGERLQGNVSSMALTSLTSPYFPGYLDSLGSSPTSPPQNFYAYFSTNLGIGYDPNDCNALATAAEADTTMSTGTNPIGLTFASTQPVYAPPTAGAQQAGVTLSPSPNPYTTSATAGSSNLTYQNAQTFQIISAGNDGLYGVGGVYTPGAQNAVLPTEHSSGGTYPNSNSSDASLRVMERDNLTNFHNGRLD